MRRKYGFTVAELLIVIAIIAVLAAVAIPIFVSSLEKARANTCNYNAQIVMRAYWYHQILGEDITLEDVLKDEHNGGKGMCPSGGEYTAKMNYITNEPYINCSKHGAQTYKFEFSDKNDDAAKTAGANNLRQLLSSIPSFISTMEKEGLYIKIDSNVATINGKFFVNAKKNGSNTTVVIFDKMNEYFGADSGFDSSLNNFRIAFDSNGKIFSISYKKGNCGYIIYSNGNTYFLSGDYFQSNPAFTVTPILQVIWDESKIALLTGGAKIS